MIDDFNREALGIEGDFSLPAGRMIRNLDQIIAWRGKPSIIRADNGPELVSGRLMIWHWAALPRNSDWPWLFNESYF